MAGSIVCKCGPAFTQNLFTILGILLVLGVLWLDTFKMALWKISALIFFPAWLGQFIGHVIEGKRPSFSKDIQFLLIGPAWLMSFIFSKLKVKF